MKPFSAYLMRLIQRIHNNSVHVNVYIVKSIQALEITIKQNHPYFISPMFLFFSDTF